MGWESSVECVAVVGSGAVAGSSGDWCAGGLCTTL